tara:strand:- start:2571 stop:3611 length:1041 start_codon:yes stop_codon:yes gene_type:complete
LPLPRITLPRLPGWLVTAFKVIVSLGLLTLLLQQVDIERMIGVLTPQLVPALIAASLVLVIQSLAIGYRWHALLEALGHEASRKWAMRQAFIGTFFNQCLPSSIGGDGYRILMAKRLGLAWQDAVSTVLVERYSGIVCLLIIASLGMIPLALALTETTVIWLFIIVIGGGIAGALLIAALAELASFRRLPGIIGRLLNAWIVGSVLAVMRRVIRSRRLLVILGTSGIASNSANAVAVWFLGKAIGVDVGIGPYLAIMSLAVLITVIPISLAGWGLRDGVIVLLLGAVGVAETEALIISIAFGLALLLSSLPGGIMLWRSVGYKTGNVEDIAAAETDTTESDQAGTL